MPFSQRGRWPKNNEVRIFSFPFLSVFFFFSPPFCFAGLQRSDTFIHVYLRAIHYRLILLLAEKMSMREK